MLFRFQLHKPATNHDAHSSISSSVDIYIFRVSCEIPVCLYQFSLGLEPEVRVIKSANYLALTLLPN